MNLTDEQLNIEICKWRGWKWCQMINEPGVALWQLQNLRMESGSLSKGTPWQVDYRIADKPDDSGPIDLRLCPSHITGLEALGNMHEAEKGLTNEQRRQYIRQMILVHPLHYNPIEPNDDAEMRIFFLASMTARQRAIALLRVVKPELFQV